MDLLKTLGLNPWVVLIQMGGFVILYLALKNLLWKPIGGVIDDRKEEWHRSEQTIDSTRSGQEKLAKEYAEKMAVIERAAYEKLQLLVKEGISSRADWLAKAQDEAAQTLQKAQSDIRSERDRALAQAGPQVELLAKQTADKALGKAAA